MCIRFGPTLCCGYQQFGENPAAADRKLYTVLEGADLPPIDSLLEGTGFELPVRGRGEAGCRAFDARLLGTGRQPAERPGHRDRRSESRHHQARRPDGRCRPTSRTISMVQPGRSGKPTHLPTPNRLTASPRAGWSFAVRHGTLPHCMPRAPGRGMGKSFGATTRPSPTPVSPPPCTLNVTSPAPATARSTGEFLRRHDVEAPRVDTTASRHHGRGGWCATRWSRSERSAICGMSGKDR